MWPLGAIKDVPLEDTVAWAEGSCFGKDSSVLERATSLGTSGSPRRPHGCDLNRAPLEDPDRQNSGILLEARIRSA